MNPTQAQIDVKNAIAEGDNVLVIAGAGSGKTSTIKYTASHVKKNSLYIVFNKANQLDAENGFAKAGLHHMTVKTVHALAYAEVVAPSKKMKQKLKAQAYGSKDFRELLPEQTTSSQAAKIFYEVKKLIEEFCCSAFSSIGEFLLAVKVKPELFNYVTEYWLILSDAQHPASITHSVYLKMYQLSQPNLAEKFDLIYLDECQDSNPVTLDIFLKQKVQKVAVGDPHQAIYQFRGAINAIESIINYPEHFKICYLVESWRFTSKIASLANKILQSDVVKGKYTIIGMKPESKEEKTTAYLCKSNAGVLALISSFANAGEKVNLIGSTKQIMNKLWAILALKTDNLERCYDAEIRSLETWENFVSLAETDPELALYYNLICTYNVKELGEMLEKTIVDPSKNESSDITISTVHKSKGLEWDTVILANDFYPTKLKEGETDPPEEFWNLFYVAITRARYLLKSESEFVKTTIGV